jgi:hypothetical protein
MRDLASVLDVACLCTDLVFKSHVDGVSRDNAKILLYKNYSLYAVCKSCGTEVRLPFKRETSEAILESHVPLILKG